MTYEFLGQYGNKIASMLNLSESGSAKLVPFEEKCHHEAIMAYSRNKLVQERRINNPLRFYLKLCHSISSEKNLKISYASFNQLSAEKGYDSSSLDYLPAHEQTKPAQSVIQQSVVRERDPIYDGFIMAGLRASSLFDKIPEHMLALSDAILSLGEQGYLRAFLCGEIYQPDLATLTLGVFSLIEKQYSLQREEEVVFDLSLDEMKKRAAQGIYDYAVKLYRVAQS